MNNRIFLFLAAWNLLASGVMKAQLPATFEDLALPPSGFWNGSDQSGAITSGNMIFFNTFSPEWNSWSGFAVSNHTDTVTPGLANQYSCMAGSGVHNSRNYAVAFDFGNLRVQIPEPMAVAGAWITNSTYACLSLRQGDMFSKKFGGQSGADPDYFRIHITGIDSAGKQTGNLLFYLADFRSVDPGEDYILDKWTWADLSSLGIVSELRFRLESSDTGAWGMNTPAYFCLDNLTYLGIPQAINPIQRDGGYPTENLNQGFRVYPVPFHDCLTITAPQPPGEIMLTGLDGRIFHHSRGLSAVTGLGWLPPGLYLLRLGYRYTNRTFLITKR